ncbi:TIGR03016 family PEP-CTERM system-associated outer membrane protein [Crenothrix sp.]|uniref:TIGR03016 family PEP-CTERM system-associated outer membrane protein n=1 Tax=Crenothrix sp. TaxID=3100433 RepID=UPI00374DB499
MLKKNTFFINSCVTYIFFYHGQVYAQNWHLTPSIQLQEIYSDNITLASSDKAKSALVTSLSPAAFIVWRAGKSNLNLYYNMQNLYNAHGDGDYSLAHQLQFNAHNVLSQNRLFVNSRASISQQNINNNRLVSDNISGSRADTTTVSSVGISPTWLPSFGHYANGSVRVNADSFSSGASGSTNGNANNANGTIADSVSIAEIVQLNSGSKFKRISWTAGFSNAQSYRAGADDVTFQNSHATLRTYMDKHFSLFATVGQSANRFTSQTNSNQNGFFYTLGGRWTLSRHYWVEAGGGNNSYITVNISPMQRLSWLTTLRHNTIGTNSGTTWQTALNYRTRRSRWSLMHNNDTLTGQDILSNRNFSGGVNNDNNDNSPVLQPDPNLTGIPTTTVPLTNEVIVRESWNLAASFYTGKSSISINAFKQNRTFQTSKYTEHVSGVNATWNWQFARKTSAYLRPQWQQIDRNDPQSALSQSHDNRYDFAVGLNQSITSRLNGRLEFNHLKQTSDLPKNDYQENRVTANLFMRF